MVTNQQIADRFAECGYTHGNGFIGTAEALKNGHCIVIINRSPIYVGAFSKDCKTLAEQYPNHVSECNIS